MWVKNTKQISTPWLDLQVGPWLLAHPSVTCYSRGRGGGVSGGGGGGAQTLVTGA